MKWLFTQQDENKRVQEEEEEEEMLSVVLRTTSAGAGSVYSWTPHLSALSGAAASINLQTAQTEKHSKCKHVDFVTTSDKLRGKKCFSSDRRWSFFFFKEPLVINLCRIFFKKRKKILLLEAQTKQLGGEET